ncbi:hypothetical protein TRIP_B40229 [uncultured Desulfatiglans sp.]|nr:hypothetical protein TRIP_B40229 [uncultured Desulfatiglans sp.]
MRTTFLPFSKPSISEPEIKAVAEVLRSGWIITGPKAAEFGKVFKAYCNAEGAMALCSGTAGMHLSTSEVYGMCTDDEFDEHRSNFVLGPIHKQRWIYSCSKQMLDRVICA